MAGLRPAVGLLALVALAALGAARHADADEEFEPPATFGNGLVIGLSSTAPVTLLDHQLSNGSAYGVVSHFWTTGGPTNDQIVLDFFVDGEETPSISMQPGMASGQGYANQQGNFAGDGSPSPYGLYAAGEKMGKSGQIGGWYNYHKVLFLSHLRVVARTIGAGQGSYLVVRGHEVAKTSPDAKGLRLPSGYTVPARAKLQLARIDNQDFQPLSFVPVFSLPRGYAGLLYLVTLAASTSPAGNDYVEGCWHLYRNAQEEFPGVVLGTGLEDFFDSAYWFCALQQLPCLFAHPSSGLLHFLRVNPDGTPMTIEQQQHPGPYGPGTREELSAYRFFDQEQVGFRDGGSLQWRVGDTPSKCMDNATTLTIGNPAAVTVHAYAWAYTWPLDPHGPPAPNSPPLRDLGGAGGEAAQADSAGIPNANAPGAGVASSIHA